jgi:hypothetical protein
MNCNTICNAISECGSITASVECLASVVQGESYHYEIQLNDIDGLPLDLFQYDGIVMKLYGDAVNLDYEHLYYGYWGWPIAFNSEITETLYVLQDTQIDTANPSIPVIINQGIIAFDISYDISRYFNTGGIYAEIKLKQEESGTGDYISQPIYTIITCLKIGNVKKSTTRDFFF